MEFDKFEDGQRYHGMAKAHLANSVQVVDAEQARLANDPTAPPPDQLTIRTNGSGVQDAIAQRPGQHSLRHHGGNEQRNCRLAAAGLAGHGIKELSL